MTLFFTNNITAKLASGIGFLGYVLFKHHTLMRTRTKQRMKKCIDAAFEEYLMGITESAPMDQKLQSYLGLLSHADQYSLSLGLTNAYLTRDKKRKF